MRVLVFSHYLDLTGELVSAGMGVGEVSLLLTSDQKDKLAQVRGARRAIVCDSISSDDQAALIDLLTEVTRDHDLLVLSSDKRARELAGQVAQMLERPIATEVSSMRSEEGKLVVERMTLGGKAIAVEELPLPAIVTVQKGKFKPPEGPSVQEVVEVKLGEATRRYEVVERRAKPKLGIPLDKAEVVVAVGRGFRRKEDLKLAYELAETLGGVVGCTRPLAADLKWMPEESWIGISGVRISPKLLLVIGASGQQQFSAGIMDSKVIVAINNDPQAPIFENSDYGVVRDLYEFLPALVERLRR
ncbi:MAG: electron transfer flavoprotein subunit alpha/FixB family protein [Candidatus Korarchaeum sp.]